MAANIEYDAYEFGHEDGRRAGFAEGYRAAWTKGLEYLATPPPTLLIPADKVPDWMRGRVAVEGDI